LVRRGEFLAEEAGRDAVDATALREKDLTQGLGAQMAWPLTVALPVSRALRRLVVWQMELVVLRAFAQRARVRQGARPDDQPQQARWELRDGQQVRAELRPVSEAPPKVPLQLVEALLRVLPVSRELLQQGAFAQLSLRRLSPAFQQPQRLRLRLLRRLVGGNACELFRRRLLQWNWSASFCPRRQSQQGSRE
jgi:hypothetical protein